MISTIGLGKGAGRKMREKKDRREEQKNGIERRTYPNSSSNFPKLPHEILNKSRKTNDHHFPSLNIFLDFLS